MAGEVPGILYILHMHQMNKHSEGRLREKLVQADNSLEIRVLQVLCLQFKLKVLVTIFQSKSFVAYLNLRNVFELHGSSQLCSAFQSFKREMTS